MIDRVLSFALGIAILLLAAGCFLLLQGAGFPDGHRTELDLARPHLYQPFIAVSIALGVYSFFIGLVATDDTIRRKLVIVAVLYGLALGLTAAIDHYLYLHLDHGGGG